MSSQTEEIVRLEQLSTGYREKLGTKTVSSSLDLSLSKGEFVALLGTNGCGKSTLLRTMAGLQEALTGQIFINGIDTKTLSNKAKARLLSLVLTDKILSPYLLVEDIIGIGRYPHIGSMGILSKEDKKIVQNCLKLCQLEGYRHRAYAELSDGEQQRVMLARALAQDTPLMMLDEATAHLDLANRVALMNLLRDLAKQTNKAILLSTHELDLALQWCDTIWLMDKDGSIKQGSPEDLVLNNSFATVFNSNLFHFDPMSASFKIKRDSQKAVYIEGEEMTKLWTKRAVEREGFAVVEDKHKAELCIKIDKGQWRLAQGEERHSIDSIKELCLLLRSKAEI